MVDVKVVRGLDEQYQKDNGGDHGDSPAVLEKRHLFFFSGLRVTGSVEMGRIQNESLWNRLIS